MKIICPVCEKELKPNQDSMISIILCNSFNLSDKILQSKSCVTLNVGDSQRNIFSFFKLCHVNCFNDCAGKDFCF